MSFMDKLKSWFSGGSEGSTMADEPGTMPADAPAAEPMDAPAGPVDPLGTPMPGGMETDARDDEV